MASGGWWSAAAALALVGACARTESACEELDHYAPQGVVIASEETRCRAILDFAATTKIRYGMEFSEWLDTVYPQKSKYFMDAFLALTVPGPPDKSWQPASFAPQPSEVPCGRGEEVTDRFWNESVLSKVLRERPDVLYVSFALDITDDVATVRIFQDFNCDGVIGVTELQARFRSGHSLGDGGWQLTHPTIVAGLEE